MSPDLERVLSNLFEGLYVVDRERRIVRWNRSAEAITGFTAEEVIGTRCSDNILIHVDSFGRELCTGLCPLAAAMDDGESREAEVFLHHREGHRVPVKVRVFPLVNGDGEVEGGLELFSGTGSLEVLTSRIEKLERLALMDPLTRLPNRRHIQGRAEANLALMRRSGIPFAVVFADLDGFKNVNDINGHEAGDRLLRTVARTLASCARPFDTVGRWGGDEFVAILPGCDLAGAMAFAERACMLIRHSLTRWEGEVIRITASLGLAVSREDDSPESVVNRADGMMYRRKELGGNGVSGPLQE